MTRSLGMWQLEHPVVPTSHTEARSRAARLWHERHEESNLCASSATSP